MTSSWSHHVHDLRHVIHVRHLRHVIYVICHHLPQRITSSVTSRTSYTSMWWRHRSRLLRHVTSRHQHTLIKSTTINLITKNYCFTKGSSFTYDCEWNVRSIVMKSIVQALWLYVDLWNWTFVQWKCCMEVNTMPPEKNPLSDEERKAASRKRQNPKQHDQCKDDECAIKAARRSAESEKEWIFQGNAGSPS